MAEAFYLVAIAERFDPARHVDPLEDRHPEDRSPFVMSARAALCSRACLAIWADRFLRDENV
jgi:hypothetical protein